jgi:hypothetical protein
MKKKFLLLIVLLLYFGVNAQMGSTIPHLKKQGNSTQLIVDGKPIVLLSAELSNSAGSSMDYLEPIWPILKRLNLNSIIVPITWEMIEPVEGKFDFTCLDELITKAREYDMKLVLLWFGTWKNACSTYPPGWVRQNLNRFPRSQNPDGENTNALSCFFEQTWSADANAFAATMRHLKKIDSTQHTVVAVQVENEAGIRNFSRDYSPIANKYFKSDVPKSLTSFLQKNKSILIPEFDAIWKKSNYKTIGTWTEIFGDDADEIFMSWYIASYIEKIAKEGKKGYSLPMYVNAWLESSGSKPGEYPSGGPIAKMLPVYQAAAPHLDFFAPDIYRPDFDLVCDLFKRMDNPLFIPETQINTNLVANLFYAIGEGALCFSPFGIDKRLNSIDILKLAYGYRVISNLIPIITQYQGTGKMKGFLVSPGETKTLEMGDYELSINATKGSKLPAYGIIIAKENNEFLVTGNGFSVKFISKSKSLPHAEILCAYELIYKHNQWVKQRRLNGDETGPGSDHDVELQFFDNKPIVLTAKIFCYE